MAPSLERPGVLGGGDLRGPLDHAGPTEELGLGEPSSRGVCAKALDRALGGPVGPGEEGALRCLQLFQRHWVTSPLGVSVPSFREGTLAHGRAGVSLRAQDDTPGHTAIFLGFCFPLAQRFSTFSISWHIK